jgi:hypothetical protein
MRRRSLSTRVVALEQRATLTSAPDPVPMWLWTLIATELGDLQEHEAVATGYGRALGYEDVRSFRAGLASGEVGERHRDAVMRVPAKRSSRTNHPYPSTSLHGR